ncbi:DUF87 domain-containing protein [Leifsonia sp. H3M29-4]|uniref:helicase HerA domain-containing protein n=1 Tax=Salinibacterium metalliresistens TaxID=3031321 RepID=UPI0023DC777C|nr:DUF87 domain-containing protein [Salinibacterium metalliresistens]MDF1479382.1 DUF87 domain-containing protein [Salinibacterium metalliresistens]
MLVAAILLCLVVGVIFFFTRSWAFLGDGSPYNLVFLSAALLLVLGAYVSEPFFTKPVDAFVNSLALVIALLGVQDKESFFGYVPAIVLALVLLAMSVFVIASPPGLLEKPKHIAYRLVTSAARSTVMFPVLYLLILISFFLERPAEFWALLTVLIVLCARRPVEDFVLWVASFRRGRSLARGAQIGTVEGRLSPRLVLVHRPGGEGLKSGDIVELPTVVPGSVYGRVLYNVHRAVGVDTVVQILGDKDRAVASLTSTETTDLSTPLSGAVHSPIQGSHPGTTTHSGPSGETIVGYVGPGSTVESLIVEVPESLPIQPTLRIASVVTASIADRVFLYQVVEAFTSEEKLGLGDAHGFTSFRAQPLGHYDAGHRQLTPPQWIPEIYSPVALRTSEVGPSDADAIGVLPNTALSVPLHSPAELVTHNTAILGILGIGKSSLTFELVQKVLRSTDVRVVVIDITNEYAPSLPSYTAALMRADDIHAFDSINSRYSHVDANNHEASGNIAEYRAAVKADLLQFLFAGAALSPQIDGAERIRVFNPDYHKVSRGDKVGYHVFTTDLSQSEKTRVIAEQLFWILQQLGPATDGGRVLLVLEEAHSLVPEWNAAAQDGDRTATNGTAKVILQGRKYGMGCFVITQRTASVSKSILNQCNTIFAMRVFDDTGKQFLEN